MIIIYIINCIIFAERLIAFINSAVIWIKNKTSGYNHVLQDSIRGATAGAKLSSNLTEEEGGVNLAPYGNVSAFNSNGFSLVAGSVDSRQTNTGSETFVGWQWKAGGTAVSNTAGTITSSVSANTTAGFSVVTYTGSGSSSTVGHGLGVVPSMIIVKRRDVADNWAVYHASLGNTIAMFLNLTQAQYANVVYWDNTSPTSTVFTVRSATEVNASGGSYVAYCWAPVAGYSAFGSYTGNGSADGPFIYTGFRPRWLMIKASTGGASNWAMLDSSRDPTNVVSHQLFANLSNAEFTPYNFGDLNSNGFKIRDNSSGLQGNYNTSGETYIYACFAENPLRYANAR